ncbi:acinetodin/klebsidin/J25 family lasso peptide [Pectobacterium odoriferum]|uniref:acinetodin/klebsidin/J25 family lasso peptide n=1 Tax=Pectobacterium odoriferum TaxID=78398 RepID=UPI001373D79D|nr:acinetodin/klebsidin/J25 family lasso peptide [Pectobacterium odoriferum]QHP80220.1 acinetodin/klebsidin/J25 family lasso peptide [Pectobacterium odoriferum]
MKRNNHAVKKDVDSDYKNHVEPSLVLHKVKGKASVITKGGDGPISEYFIAMSGTGFVDLSQGNRYG